MHRAHHELTLRAAAELEANLLIHPVVGMTKPGDVDHYTRVRCYQAILPRYPQQHGDAVAAAAGDAHGRAARGGAGTRSSARTTAARTSSSAATTPVRATTPTGKPFYGPYDAQELLREHEEELGVEMVPFQMMVYVEDHDAYRAGRRGARGRAGAEHLGHRAARAAGRGPRDPRVVHLPGGRRPSCGARHPPRQQPGLHGLLHRPVGVRQVDDRQRRCWSSCSRWAAGR